LPATGQLGATCQQKSIEKPPVCAIISSNACEPGGKNFMSTFRIKGRICCKLRRKKPENVISSKFIKSFRFKGKMVNKTEELLPNWQLLWNFSPLLDFKGTILTNPKESLLKRTIFRGFSDILDLSQGKDSDNLFRIVALFGHFLKASRVF